MSVNDGGPAFPVDADSNEDGVWRTRRRGGMSLRDYFAAHALAGDLAGQQAGVASDEDADFIAQRAYDFADAMLARRRPTAPGGGALAIGTRPTARRRPTRGKKSSSSSSSSSSPHK